MRSCGWKRRSQRIVRTRRGKVRTSQASRWPVMVNVVKSKSFPAWSERDGKRELPASNRGQSVLYCDWRAGPTSRLTRNFPKCFNNIPKLHAFQILTFNIAARVSLICIYQSSLRYLSTFFWACQVTSGPAGAKMKQGQSKWKCR